MGYAWADLPRSAMKVFVVAEDSVYLDKARLEACSLAQNVWDVRHQMELDVESGDIYKMIERAYQLPQKQSLYLIREITRLQVLRGITLK